MFSDIYKIREVANGLCLEVEGKVSDSPAPREGGGVTGLAAVTQGPAAAWSRACRAGGGGRVWGGGAGFPARDPREGHPPRPGACGRGRAGCCPKRCGREPGAGKLECSAGGVMKLWSGTGRGAWLK